MIHSSPKKSLGQNFLVSTHYKNKIIETIRRDYVGEPIIEIGPGRGALTHFLSSFAGSLVLVEKDTVLADSLRSEYCSLPSVSVFCGDFLDLKMNVLPSCAVVVGNLPYNVATNVFKKLLQNKEKFLRFYLMFQREVVDRMLAKPGSPDYGPLSIVVRLFSEPCRLFQIPPAAFFPQPKIVSSFIQFNLNEVSYASEQTFITFVERIFLYRRKTIDRVLKMTEDFVFQDQPSLKTQWWEKNIKGKRAYELSVEQLKKVYQIIKTPPTPSC